MPTSPYRLPFIPSAIVLIVVIGAFLAPGVAFAQAGMIIQGTVVDEAFQPVSDCRVVFRNADDGSVLISDPTGDNGVYILVVERGARYAPLSILMANGRRVELQGYPVQTIHGKMKIDVQVPVAITNGESRAFNGSDRFYEAFVEDAQIVDRSRIEMAFRTLDFDDSRIVLSEAIAAVQFAGMPQVEFGARMGVGGVQNDLAPDTGGVTDLDIWAKFVTMPISANAPRYAFGAVLTLPTGDEEAGLGFDSLRSRLFGAARFERDRHAWSVQGGLVINEDATFSAVTLDGQVALFAGVGWMWSFRETLRLSVEARFEGERFDGSDDDTRLVAGWTWRAVENMKVRASLGVGLTDAAPDVQGQLGIAFDF